MKKIILMGRTGAGKTTLMQKLRGDAIAYQKTQYIHYEDIVIDTPGEYAETQHLGRALALYSYEADIVGLLADATEPYSLYPPNITCMVNREVIGIVTKIDDPAANPERVASWLRNSGCKTIFFVNTLTGEGIDEILAYLDKP